MNSQGPRVVRFVEQFLTLGGSHYGEPFKLLDFQKEVIDDIYKVDDDGRRIHRTYLLGLPRKNGKTLLAAALGVYHLIADDADKAPVVIAAAGDRQQARLVFDEVRPTPAPRWAWDPVASSSTKCMCIGTTNSSTPSRWAAPPGTSR